MKVFDLRQTKKSHGVFSPWCLIILFCLFQSYLLAFEFNLIPMKVNFNNSVSTKNNILVYGDYGSYLISTDRGVTWKQKDIGLYNEIFDMVYYNDTLWALVDNNSLYISTDEGLNWEMKKIQIGDEDTTVRILVDDESIFLRGKKSIYKINRKFEIISSITSDSLNIEWAYNKTYDPDLPVKFKYITKGFPPILFFNNKIITGASAFIPNSKGFLEIDKNLERINLIDIRGKFPFNIDSMDVHLTRIFKYNNKWVFVISSHLFITDSILTKFEYFFPDTSFLSYLDKNSGRIRGDKDYFMYGCYPPTVFLHKNDVFAVSPVDSNFDNEYTGLVPSYKLVGIKKYYNINGKDTFLLYGNYFKDIYKTSRFIDRTIPGGEPEGNFIPDHGLYYSFGFSSPSIYFDSIWMFNFYHKSLLISKDNCKTWNLISYLSGKPVSILNDTTYFFVRVGQNATDINKVDQDLLGYPPVVYDSNTKQRLYNYNTFYDLKIFHLDSTGFGFATGFLPFGPPYFILTYDNWKTLEFRKNNFREFIEPRPMNFVSNLCWLGDNILLATSDTNLVYRNYPINKIFLVDTSLKTFKLIVNDTISKGIILHILKDDSTNIGKFTSIFLIFDSTSLFNRVLEIRRTLDTGHTWEKILILKNVGKVNQIYEHNPDSVFITFKEPDKVYLYDRTRDTLQLLWQPETDDGQNPLLMVISDRFYIVGKGLFLENTDRSDLTQWREGKWDYGKPNFESVIFKGNVAIAGLSDSLRPFNYYKITLRKETPTTVESEVEKRYYTTKFWASEPYPQPAGVRVKARIAWDGSFDVGEAIDGVYDSMGRKVEGKERIRVTLRDKGYGELEWECSGVPAGVYFILLRWAGGSESVPVVVE